MMGQLYSHPRSKTSLLAEALKGANCSYKHGCQIRTGRNGCLRLQTSTPP